ncbi:MAG TPA: ABC transporter permease [Actinomycetota bacterium]|nr:ABC transporter permease [Actinomycetota bacterium]
MARTDLERGTTASRLEDELAGLDALETPAPEPRGPLRRVWESVWPPLAGGALALAVWQAVVLSGWKKPWVLPGPGAVFERFFQDLGNGDLLEASSITMRRAVVGYGLALIIGCALGLAIAHFGLLRRAFGSLVTGLQTMPSIAWFPLAVLLFQLSEGAILFVVVLGAAPAVANGLIGGIDHVPPALLRAGKVLGASGLNAYRHVILPAALPSFVGGLKQAWAFAWRSLMAGELLGVVTTQQSIGYRLQISRDFSDARGMIAAMVLILLIGIVVDLFIFGKLDRVVRRRWGLIDPATA